MKKKNIFELTRAPVIFASILTGLIPFLLFSPVVYSLWFDYFYLFLTAGFIYSLTCGYGVFRTLRKINDHESILRLRILDCSLKISAAQEKQVITTVKMISDIAENKKDSDSAVNITTTMSENLISVASTSEEVSNSISGVATAAEEISANINSIANTAEEMSTNTTMVAGTTEQMSSNFNFVEKAIREMSDSIQVISKSANEAATIAAGAVDKANLTTEVMTKLGKSAEEIGKVIHVIQTIAQMTNLLALNAAIEAASAGEAGKGFAVVANEVKDLARQTATATEDITNKIEGIQSNTKGAIEAIGEIAKIILRIHETEGQISILVEGQRSATHEISRNVSEAVKGVNEISRNIGQSAQGANLVSKNINEIAMGANDVARNVAEVATGIRSYAEKLEESSVMIKETERYIKRALASANTVEQGMNQINISVDLVSDLAHDLQEAAKK